MFQWVDCSNFSWIERLCTKILLSFCRTKKIQSTAPERAVIKTSYKVIGEMTSQDPVTSKSHTFQDHHGDVRSRLSESATECRAGGRFPVSWLFFGLFPGLSLSHCFFLSFFFFLIFWDWEVSVSFSCLTSLSFVCAHARHFCSVVVGFSISQPLFSQLKMSSPYKNTQAWRVLTAGWFLRHNMYCLTKWKCDSDAVMSEYKRPTVASLLSRWLRSWKAASQQLRVDPATADAKLESTLTNENNKKLRYLIADLKSHVKLALAFELTRQNRHVRAGVPGCRTTPRSPTVRLNSKLFKATLTSRTEKMRRQNIRLNSCSFT